MGKHQRGTEALTGRKLEVIVERRHFWSDGIEIQVCGHPLTLNVGDTIKVQSRRQKRGEAETAPLQTGGRLNCEVVPYARPS